MNATLGHDQRFEFKRNQSLIKLDIPPAGTTTSDKAWRITALGPPVVCSAIADKPTEYTVSKFMCRERGLLISYGFLRKLCVYLAD